MITLATPEEEDAYRYRRGAIPSYTNQVQPEDPAPDDDADQLALFEEPHA